MSKSAATGTSQYAQGKNKILRLKDLQPFQQKLDARTGGSPAPQISQYFVHLLELHLSGDVGRTLTLPSVMALSGFFNRSELDVLDALQELQQYGYDYELLGLDGAIQIRLNPISRYAGHHHYLRPGQQDSYWGKAYTQYQPRPLGRGRDHEAPLKALTCS